MKVYDLIDLLWKYIPGPFYAGRWALAQETDVGVFLNLPKYAYAWQANKGAYVHLNS